MTFEKFQPSAQEYAAGSKIELIKSEAEIRKQNLIDLSQRTEQLWQEQQNESGK